MTWEAAPTGKRRRQPDCGDAAIQACLNDLGCPALNRVIKDQQLEIVVALRKNAADGLGNIVFGIVCRHAPQGS